MSDASEVTIGEVYRLSLRIDQRLGQITRDMVGRQEYEADHEALAASIKAMQVDLQKEITTRAAEDLRIVESAAAAKRWAIGVALTAGSFFIAAIAFIIRLSGGPA